jgi:hypothetical protein
MGSIMGSQNIMGSDYGSNISDASRAPILDLRLETGKSRKFSNW